MKSYVYVAIFLSVVLIGGSLVLRLKAGPSNSALMAIQNDARVATDPSTIFGATTASTSPVSTEPLSEIDLISRQLFSEYAQLTRNGQATPENLEGLGIKYAENIFGQQSIATPSIPLSSLLVVSNSTANLNAYKTQIILFKAKYTAQARKLGTQNFSEDLQDPKFKTFMNTAATMYTTAAKELLKMPVPTPLIHTHAALISSYLVDGEVMRQIADPNTDPVRIYPAIALQIENTEREAQLFLNIKFILQANGIIVNSI